MQDYSHFRVLVSGIGSIGRRHLRNLHSAGVCDLAYSDPYSILSPDDLNGIKVEVFQDFSDALTSFSPDVVFICSPTKEHVLQAILAAKSGAYLFIEKPLSYQLEGIEELEKILIEKKRQAMIACNMRFHAGPKKIKELLLENAVGDVLSARIYSCSYLPRWRRPVPYKESYSADPLQGGVILDCIHEIDLALWYLGDAELLHATVTPASNIGLTVDGAAHLLLQHKNGVTSSLHLSFIHPTWRRGCEILGTDGMLEWELKNAPGNQKGEAGDPLIHLFNNDGKLLESFSAESDRNKPYLEELHHFLQKINVKDNEMVGIFPKEGKNALEIAIAARSY